MSNIEGTEGPIGLEFLGFYFRNRLVSKHRGVKSTRGVKQTFIQVSTPSRKSIREHKKNIKYTLKVLKSAPLETVIKTLSTKIQGWTTYHSITQCSSSFSKLDGWMWKRLWKWSLKRYKTSKNAKAKCFSVKGWNFGFRSKGKTYTLNRHDQTKVRKYVKIKPYASIYNGDLIYFANRLSYHNHRLNRLHRLLKSQEYKCRYCQIIFKPNDIIELHHVLLPDNTRSDKLEFLHGHCHDNIHN